MKINRDVHLSFVTFAQLALGLLGSMSVSGAPTINSVAVTPDPLLAGQPFAVTVSASSDVVQGVATVDFRPWSTSLLRVTLAKQGNDWVGSGVIPSSLQPPPNAQANVKALVLNASRQRAEFTKPVAVSVPQTITADFDPVTGVLTILGDDLDNQISVSRDVTGRLLVNGGTVVITGGVPTVANTSLIKAFGFAGNDLIAADQSNGALPAVDFSGGPGNDTLVGGAGADRLTGGPDADTLEGKGGSDQLFGEAGDDTMIGGDGDDQCFGDAGNDRMIWNPGDDTDLNEGGADVDTVEVNGGNGAESFTTTANGTRVRFDRLSPAPFAIDIGTCENLVLNANGGDDSFSATGNLAALIKITVDGGPGDDTILGSNGNDVLLGGDGDDFIDGQQGNDVAFLGANNDIFQWDPGDGSDTVEGQAGTDKLLFNGSNGSEIFAASANGARVLFTRNLGNITMDLDDVESIDLNTLGSADTVTINDLTGTDLLAINVNTAGTIGGTLGDAAADVIIVNGTDGSDIIDVFGAGTSVSVVGSSAQVTIANSEGANDSLVINALGGNDGVTATTLPAGVIKLTLDGGAGDDTLLGSQGADVLLGGENNDFLFGDNGNDLALMGAGDDVFQWDPGDGNDTIEGQGGADKMLFFGSNAAENIDVISNGGRVLFLRNVANVTMDLDDVEAIEFRALGGADNVVIGSLSGTDLTQIGLDLRGPNGGGDGASDNVTVNGTQGADVFGAAGDAGGIQVFGLQANVSIFFQEQSNDGLTLNGQGGDDVIDASSLEADGIQLALNGGLGDDVLLGSEGSDLVNGGDGDDTALLGQGNDTFVWNPGDDNDTIEGQAGLDTMLFNGANVAETINISANGGRTLFTRSVASVVMDLNDLERVLFNARGGADAITVNDLSGTDITEINLSLEGTPGSGTGDGAADIISVSGSSGNNAIVVTESPGAFSVAGLPATVNITTFETALDQLLVRGLGGDDSLRLTGSNSGESMDVLANGARARFVRNAILLLETDGVERAFLNALGGADSVVIGDLSGTGLAEISLDLSGGGGDGVADNLVVNGTQGDDVITVANALGGLRVSGLPAAVNITGADASLDRLTVNALGGNDAVDASTLSEGRILYSVNGGLGDDVLLGSHGDDLVNGGDGDDTALLGDGDDTFVWNPGDDNDTVEGQGNFDTLLFNGANVAETINLSANGGRTLFTRNVANVIMDLNGVEQVQFNALGGADVITVNDLTGTDVTGVHLNLEGTLGSGTGDNAADTVSVNGTTGDDVMIVVGAAASGISVIGTAATVTVAGSEASLDRLTVNALAGDDVVEASGLAAGAIQLTCDGGADDDVLVGSAGNDTLLGGPGDDVLLGGPGLDVLDGGTGDNIVIQD